MKKLFFLPAAASFFMAVFTGCNEKMETGIPELAKYCRITAAENSSLPVSTLDTGKSYSISFYATDDDLDVSSIIVRQINEETQRVADAKTYTFMFGQSNVSQMYSVDYKPKAAGKWTIEARLVDGKGHTSRPRTWNVTVD